MDLPPAFLELMHQQASNPIVQHLVKDLPVFTIPDEIINGLEQRECSSFMIPFVVEEGMILFCRSDKHKTKSYSVRVTGVRISGHSSFVFFKMIGRASLPVHTSF